MSKLKFDKELICGADNGRLQKNVYKTPHKHDPTGVDYNYKHAFND